METVYLIWASIATIIAVFSSLELSFRNKELKDEQDFSRNTFRGLLELRELIHRNGFNIEETPKTQLVKINTKK